MKEGITIYANKVAVARIKNRRIAVRRNKDNSGFRIEFVNVIRGRRWKTAICKRIHGSKVITAVNLSDEGLSALYQCIYALANYKEVENDKT